MDGAASDLRTGLPWQMVEIHEPVRSLFIIETTSESMLRIMTREPGIGRLCRNSWVQLAVLHPRTRQISLFHDGQFEVYNPEAASLPQAASSVDWYRGWRDNLEFCQLTGARKPPRRVHLSTKHEERLAAPETVACQISHRCCSRWGLSSSPARC